MSRLTMAVAFGAGYVFGARAGQERYRQIQSKARSLWQSDAVQTQATKAQDAAKEQATKAQDAAKERLSDRRDEPSSRDGSVTTVADAPPSEDMVDPSGQPGGEDPDGAESLRDVSPGALS